ncbi:hypothetical protein [Georgenia sp. SUBG003]|uniref:hypothetical protein n=1 Tax=Georgenia sp. SUBG003 TaxID=1497974 RepID=UPI003AB8BD58
MLGTYGLLDGATPDWAGLVLLAVGAAVAVLASALAGRRVRRTRYRPDPWRAEEWAVAGCGALVAAAVRRVRGAPPPVRRPSRRSPVPACSGPRPR